MLNATALGGAIVLPVGAPPNTVIPLPLIGSITLNEQEQNASGIIVRSVHLRVDALGIATADIVIAESGCFPFGANAFATGGAGGSGRATAASATSGVPNLTG